MKNAFIALAFASLAIAAPALAAEVIVTPSSTSWRAEAGNSGTAVITSTQARSGNGSLELKGDRTRFYTGTMFPNILSSRIAPLRDVTALTFDWRIAGDSINALNPDYTPALRLSIFDSTTLLRRDLVWEGAYNGTYGNTTRDTWYSTTAASLFYLTGPGVAVNENAGRTIADWASFFGANSFVGGISVGQGSSAGAGYHAFADNVTLTTKTGSTTYNFETASAVPEASTWGMMILGFGVMGAAMRRRSTKVSFA